jgi:hypothetical protein
VLPRARQRDLASPITGQRYRIFVSAPSIAPPPNGHPVFYVLDGNAAFPLAAHIARNIERRQPVTGIPSPVVVGVGYAGDEDYHVDARARDYTLPVGSYDPRREGGADRFLDFLTGELQLAISAEFAGDRNRQALFGHSYGGLLTLHALFSRTAAFSTYVASSPSLWWQDRHLFKDADAWIEANVGRRAWPAVQISVGSSEDDPPRGKMSPELLAERARRPMVGLARELAACLRAVPAWQRRVAYHEFPGEDHGSAWLPALSRGINTLLDPDGRQ